LTIAEDLALTIAPPFGLATFLTVAAFFATGDFLAGAFFLAAGLSSS